MPRMNILNALERAAFDVPPVFNSSERKKHFDAPVGIRDFANQLRTATNQVDFLLAAGYFSATKKFYAVKRFHERDIDYVCCQMGVSAQQFNRFDYDKQTLLRHQGFIRQFYGFQEFDAQAEHFAHQEVEGMVRSQLKPKLIFFRLVDQLIRQKIVVPSYNRLRQLILKVLNARKNQLVGVVEKALTPAPRALLDGLLEKATDDQNEPINRYRLTLLKQCSQSTRPGKIKDNIEDFVVLHGLYDSVTPALTALAVPQEAIRYYANSVIRSEIFQVSRRSAEDRYLHLIAFITHQFFRLHDALVDIFINSLQSLVNAAQRDHKEKLYERRENRRACLQSLVSFLDKSLTFMETVEHITEDLTLNDGQKVASIRELLRQDPQREETVHSLKSELEEDLQSQDYCAILEAKSAQMQNRATPILKALSFRAEPGAATLAKAIDHFKANDGAIGSDAPTEFLSSEERSAVLDGKFHVSLYKALLFVRVMGGIKSGNLNLEHSYKYRPLDDYLISRERWTAEKTTLLERAGLTQFADPNKLLDDLDAKLFAQYQHTNTRLRTGANAFVRRTKTGSLCAHTPKQEEKDAEPLQELFPEKRYVALSEALATVDRYSGFLDEFEHWQQRYHRSRPAKKTFIAGIAALGCDIGLGKILKISRDIDVGELENTVNWYFHPESVAAANDALLNFMDRLELPNVYRASPEVLHTSSDGQKFEVQADSLNANYSFKYFGKGKGVSIYSFIDERHLLFYSTVISAAERESAYVIDGLMHNDVIKSDIHSTDTHGYTEAVFGAMHLLDFSYAPRIKNLKRQRLYLFKSRQDVGRSDWMAAPSGYIDRLLIENQWDEILRFIATIKLKETTASDLFRRLNSYSIQHTLYRALKAFGRIIKSIFILRYVDDVELRQAIERQLNKIESSHRFARAISVGNGREMAQAEKQDQEVVEACKRLIKNTIVCWNYLYLTQKIAEETDPEVRKAMLASVAAGSVVSWQHINLLGEYDFSDEKLRDSVGIRPPKSLGLQAA